jgi:hypothetical protein
MTALQVKFKINFGEPPLPALPSYFEGDRPWPLFEIGDGNAGAGGIFPAHHRNPHSFLLSLAFGDRPNVVRLPVVQEL